MALLLALAPILARADDLGDDSDSSLAKSSSDHRIKVTLLYVGPIKDPQIHQPFVVTYLVEDCRSDEELQRHPWKLPGGAIDSNYYLAPSIPELKDGTHHLVDISVNADERSRQYVGASEPIFKKIYPGVVVPVPAQPDRAGIYEYFYKMVPPGPYQIVLHDSIPAYGRNNFHFHDIDTSAFTVH